MLRRRQRVLRVHEPTGRDWHLHATGLYLLPRSGHPTPIFKLLLSPRLLMLPGWQPGQYAKHLLWPEPDLRSQRGRMHATRHVLQRNLLLNEPRRHGNTGLQHVTDALRYMASHQAVFSGPSSAMRSAYRARAAIRPRGDGLAPSRRIPHPRGRSGRAIAFLVALACAARPHRRPT